MLLVHAVFNLLLDICINIHSFCHFLLLDVHTVMYSIDKKTWSFFVLFLLIKRWTDRKFYYIKYRIINLARLDIKARYFNRCYAALYMPVNIFWNVTRDFFIRTSHERNTRTLVRRYNRYYWITYLLNILYVCNTENIKQFLYATCASWNYFYDLLRSDT